MSTPDSQRRAPRAEFPSGDPWHAFGYLVAGVAFYGVLGWLADRWLGTDFLVAVGIVLGACLGLYLTIVRFTRAEAPAPRQDRVDKDQN